jgi:ribonucleotide monophosphatase NagD (HAD superfamily)
VERGDRLIPCAGAIALAYERIGGAVHYPGKPHRPIYEAALAADPDNRAGQLARVLAIGDALATDVAGARGYGLDCLMVARGIHAADLGVVQDAFGAEAALDWLGRQPIRPTSLCRELSW